MTNPKIARYLVYDPNVEETYFCETKEEALGIVQNALENDWPISGEDIYIATVTPIYKTVYNGRWEGRYGDEGREYRIEKIQP